MKQPNKKTNIRPYTKQFFKGNYIYLALALMQTLLFTACNLLISWLIQQILDLIAGENTGFTLSGLALIGLAGFGGVILAFGFAYFSKPRFISKAIAQYKNYVFEQLMKKNISAFWGENTPIPKSSFAISLRDS